MKRWKKSNLKLFLSPGWSTHVETKSFLNRKLTAMFITLGIATTITFSVWAMKNEETHPMLLRLLTTKMIQYNTDGATITFNTGQKGRLYRNHKDYKFYLTLVQQGIERQHPIGVRINSAGEIVEIARADNDFIAFLAEENENTVKVWFQMHDGIAYLERQHPRFNDIERNLNRSLKEKKRIWFVWRLPRLTIEDVIIIEEDFKTIKLTDLTLLPVEFRAAAEAAAGYLKEKGEQPSEFYVGGIIRKNNIIVLPLWHISALALKQKTVGNPGGKCRNLEYETVTGRISKELFWQ